MGARHSCVRCSSGDRQLALGPDAILLLASRWSLSSLHGWRLPARPSGHGERCRQRHRRYLVKPLARLPCFAAAVGDDTASSGSGSLSPAGKMLAGIQCLATRGHSSTGRTGSSQTDLRVPQNWREVAPPTVRAISVVAGSVGDFGCDAVIGSADAVEIQAGGTTFTTCRGPTSPRVSRDSA